MPQDVAEEHPLPELPGDRINRLLDQVESILDEIREMANKVAGVEEEHTDAAGE